MDYEALLSRAKDYIENEVEPGTIFEAKSLFEGVEWDALAKGDRIGFGRYFANAVRDGAIKDVIRIERAKNNHTRYIKMEGTDT